MPRVIFSLTEHQAAALVALADGDTIKHPRVETSLQRKGLVTTWRNGKYVAALTRRGRSAAALARALIDEQ